MHATVEAALIAFNTPIEGLITWMYGDIKGIVTTGIGCQLFSAQNAKDDFNWFDEATDSPVTDLATVSKDYEAVKAHFAASATPPIADKYKSVTQLRLHEGDPGIAEAVIKRARGAEGALKTLMTNFTLPDGSKVKYQPFAAYDRWPADAQLGLISMAYAMGVGTIGDKFPKFMRACFEQRWYDAANECRINPVGNPGVIPRNWADKILFNNAANIESADITELVYPFVLECGLQPTLKTGVGLTAPAGAAVNEGNEDVSIAQTLLNHHGASLKTDGKFGDGTAKVVKAFQDARHIPTSTVITIDATTWAALAIR